MILWGIGILFLFLLGFGVVYFGNELDYYIKTELRK